jgi:predicted CopG family antitoxin
MTSAKNWTGRLNLTDGSEWELTKTVELTDEVYDRLVQMAKEQETTPEQLLLQIAQQKIDAARESREEAREALEAFAQSERARAMWIRIWGDDKLFGKANSVEKFMALKNPLKIVQKPVKWLE